MKKTFVFRGLAVLAGVLLVLVLVKVFERPSVAPEVPTAAASRAPFLPARLAAACVAAIEKPNGTKALLADAGAEAYRASLETLGFLCSSSTVMTAGRKFDLVFATAASDAETLAALALNDLSETGILVQALDVFEMSGERFRKYAEDFPCVQAHLWMPGTFEWLLVGRVTPRRLKLEAMMEVFAREAAFDLLAQARATALSDLFAGYVGTRDDWGAAFREKGLQQAVQPVFFVTKEIPSLDWIVRGEVDEDIFRQTMAEIRSMQVVRRLVLEGELLSEAGRVDEATDAWARARRRNPNDLFLVERCDCLMRNASALERIGNFGAAAKCYETMIVVNPTDAQAVFRYGLCLKRMGHAREANRVLQRVREMQQ